METDLVPTGAVDGYYYMGATDADLYPVDIRPDGDYLSADGEHVYSNLAMRRITVTNDPERAFDTRDDLTVTYAEGYDGSALAHPANVLLMSPAAMKRCGVEPGDQLRVAHTSRLYFRAGIILNRLGWDRSLTDVEKLSSVWDEVMAYMEESTVVYTVIGTLNVGPGEQLIVAPVSEDANSPTYWGSRMPELEAYLSGPERIEEVRSYLREKFPKDAGEI